MGTFKARLSLELSGFGCDLISAGSSGKGTENLQLHCYKLVIVTIPHNSNDV